MSDNPESPGERSFSPPDGEEGSPFGQTPPFEQSFEQKGAPSEFAGAPAGGGELSMAWSVARMWIKEHQREAMLGAFATGVFVGAYLRD